jgi:hypothetical protein
VSTPQDTAPPATGRDPGYWFVVAALGFAVLATLAALVVPFGMSQTETAAVTVDTEGETEVTEVTSETRRHTLAETEGWQTVVAVTSPLLLLSALPLLARRRGPAIALRATSTVLLGVVTVLAMFSIGILYLPSAAAMAIATIVAIARR